MRFTQDEEQNNNSASSPTLGSSQRILIAWVLAVYLGAALALHGANIASTNNRVFGLHQLVTDEIQAVALALGVPGLLALISRRSKQDEDGSDR